MRILLSILLTCFIAAASAQTKQTTKFDNTYKLKDGIYTSYTELLSNNPAFPGCSLIVNPNRKAVYTYELNYCNISNESNIMPYRAQLYATVLNGKLAVYYKDQLSMYIQKVHYARLRSLKFQRLTTLLILCNRESVCQ